MIIAFCFLSVYTQGCFLWGFGVFLGGVFFCLFVSCFAFWGFFLVVLFLISEQHKLLR